MVPLGMSVGALAGLAWIVGLRSWMAVIAGPESTYTWDTALFVVLPGIATGSLLGLAAGLRLEGRPAPRWLVASPLLSAAVVLVPPYFIQLVTTGLGGGALMVPLVAMAVGYTVAGRRRWARVITGVLAVAGLAGTAAIPALLRPELAPGTPEGLLAAAHGIALVLLLGLAAALPYDRRP